MESKILARQDFENLGRDQQIDLMRGWIELYGTDKVARAWGIARSTYYAYLERKQIKDQVTRRKTTSRAEKMEQAREAESNMAANGKAVAEASFSYELNQKLNGKEAGDKLGRLAHFLNGEMRIFDVEIRIHANGKELSLDDRNSNASKEELH